MEFIIFIQSFSSPFLDMLFQIITMMGEEFFFFAAATLFLWCFDKEFGYRLGLAFISGSALNFALKDIFSIPRPIGEQGIRSLRLETAVGSSFPSGHTQNAASFWTSLMTNYRIKWVYAAGTASILLVALSRVYLGVHTPVDVLGGMVVGIGWVFVSNAIFDFAKKTGKKGIFLCLIIPVLLGMPFFYGEYYFRAAGALTGFLAGYIIESGYVRHNVRAAWWKQIIKYAAGITVLLGIRSIIKYMLPDFPASHFFRYFLMALWVTLIAPCLFKLIFNAKDQAAG